MIRRFEIEYLDKRIKVDNEDCYRLTWPDGRQLVIDANPVPAQETTSGTISRQNKLLEWVVKSKDEGPDWINREQLQVIGELILNRQHSIENDRQFIHSQN